MRRAVARGSQITSDALRTVCRPGDAWYTITALDMNSVNPLHASLSCEEFLALYRPAAVIAYRTLLSRNGMSRRPAEVSMVNIGSRPFALGCGQAGGLPRDLGNRFRQYPGQPHRSLVFPLQRTALAVRASAASTRELTSDRAPTERHRIRVRHFAAGCL